MHHVFHRAAFPQVRGTMPHPTLTAMALGQPINQRVSWPREKLELL